MSGQYEASRMQNLQISVSDSVIHQPLEGESVLLDLVSGNYYGINGVGSRVWTLLQMGQHVPQIIDVLLDEYSVTEEALLEDVRQFLIRLESNGIISIVDASKGE